MRAAPIAPEIIHADIVDDAIEPRQEGAIRIEAAEGVEQLDEDELGDLLRRFVAVRDVERADEDTPVMQPANLGERRAILLLAAPVERNEIRHIRHAFAPTRRASPDGSRSLYPPRMPFWFPRGAFYDHVEPIES